MDRLWGHGFRVLGFPEGLADGVWATGHIHGEQATRWFQVWDVDRREPVSRPVAVTALGDASGR